MKNKVVKIFVGASLVLVGFVLPCQGSAFSTKTTWSLREALREFENSDKDKEKLKEVDDEGAARILAEKVKEASKEITEKKLWPKYLKLVDEIYDLREKDQADPKDETKEQIAKV